MRRFSCPACGNQVHFNNSQCVQCAAVLGYLPSRDLLVALDDGMPPRPCANRDLIGCNWMTEGGPDSLCLSCRHTTKIPDIDSEANRKHWARLERAKRRLLYVLLTLGLPLGQEPGGDAGFLHFEFLSDEIALDGTPDPVMTGHANGRITINIAEADDAYRERVRSDMGEPYRTLIGHFRHEVGHYYWDALLAGTPMLGTFRACFGDETRDYAEALQAHYAAGPPPDWQDHYVSAYASAHPWEDFAETWAHYFHMISSLETAHAYGIDPLPFGGDAPRPGPLPDPYHVEDVQVLIDHWVPLTVAMNAMNRSMGNRDYYPFVLTRTTLQKLKFVHELIRASAERPQQLRA